MAMKDKKMQKLMLRSKFVFLFSFVKNACRKTKFELLLDIFALIIFCQISES